MPYLKYYTGGKAVIYPIEKDIITIGREKSCDVALLMDALVSKRHAQIKKQQMEYVISDLGSANGTFVNGKRIKSWILRDEDIITVGKTAITFRAGIYQTMRIIK